MPFSDIQDTPFGVAVERWLESNSFPELLQTPIKDQEVGVPHTGLSYFALLKEILQATNRNIDKGRNIVQPPSGLTGLVSRLVEGAYEQSVVAFHASEGGQCLRDEAITGNESRQSFEDTFRTRGLDPALAHYDASVIGFSHWPSAQNKRVKLEESLRAIYQRAEMLRSARAAEDSSRRQADQLRAVEVEIKRISEQLNRVVHVSKEIRHVDTGQQKSFYIFRKQLFRIETRNQETRGDGSVSHTPWVYAGEEWRRRS
jgi:hypothetical protein